MTKMRDIVGNEPKHAGFRQKNHMVNAGRRRRVSQVRAFSILLAGGPGSGRHPEYGNFKKTADDTNRSTMDLRRHMTFEAPSTTVGISKGAKTTNVNEYKKVGDDLHTISREKHPWGVMAQLRKMIDDGTIRVYAFGTSDGVKKAWDERGRGRKEEEQSEEEQSEEERDAADEEKSNEMQDPRGLGGGWKKDPTMWKKGMAVLAPDGREGEVLFSMPPMGAKVKMSDGTTKLVNNKDVHYVGWKLK